jgi:hypothetical protein
LKGEIRRFQELQAMAPIAIKEGEPSTPSLGGDFNTILASYVAPAAWNNNLLYMPKKEITRLQALQSEASIASNGVTPNDTLGSDLGEF